MAFKFTLNKESIKRRLAVYVVVAKGRIDTKLYVGKTGDNNDGCNPVISRCGNHFSYNSAHSQIRNEIPDHESHDYTYVFEHFYGYPDDAKERRLRIDKINEMERRVNQRVQKLIEGKKGLTLLNPFEAAGYVTGADRAKRKKYHTPSTEKKVDSIIAAVREQL